MPIITQYYPPKIRRTSVTRDEGGGRPERDASVMRGGGGVDPSVTSRSKKKKLGKKGKKGVKGEKKG